VHPLSQQAGLLALVVTSGACNAAFNTPQRLDDTRILAIAAEPPQPAVTTSTVLRPLVYVPDGEAVTLSWSWCPLPTVPDDDYACHLDQTGADALFATLGVTAPPLDLGPGESASWPNPFPPAVAAALCASGTTTSPIPFSCPSTGLPVTIRLVVHSARGDLPAVTTVFAPTDTTSTPNQNPVIAGLTLGDSARPIDGEPTVARGTQVPLHALIDPSSAEPLANPDPDGKLFERLSLSWFVEGGDFGSHGTGGARTGFLGDPNDPASPFAAALDNSWDTPNSQDFPKDSVRIVVVVRDSRGGVAWTDGVVHLEPTP
jgi:hypothetical protein